MTLWDLVNSARDYYVSGYRQTLLAQRPKLTDLSAEVMVMPTGVEDVPEAYRRFRVDLIWREQGQPRVGAIQPPGPQRIDPLTIDYPDGQTLTAESFRWDDCVFLMTPAPGDDGPLRQWLAKWMDLEEKRAPDESGLRAVVHSMTPPAPTPDGSFVAVDFGSAPAEAVTSLISTLFACGARSIRIGASAAADATGG